MTEDQPTVCDKIEAAAYRFPTPEPEADGTLEWDATTAVTVTVEAGGRTGLGWTYSSAAAATVITDILAPALRERSPFDIPGCWQAMRRACRNIGAKGIGAHAISAVDIALWDLQARLHAIPLPTLFGATRTAVPVYGSGGFTTLDDDQLDEQIDRWHAAGCAAMKIKIGENSGGAVDRDLHRVRRLRQRAGHGVRLMVDANGGYTRGQARRVGAELDELGVAWFEEPVTSDDIGGLGSVRAALRCEVAAGEYIYDDYDTTRLVTAVDCLQLDVTRCGGYTGLLRCAGIGAANGLEVSAHCAPALHAPIAGAVPNLRDVEWFADHARLEPLLADGVPPVRGGLLHVPADRPGHGMRLSATAEEYRVR
ncbi:enolase C-terminal domain-like protein [Nocardia transvalensis]|uniref:enolase C-terminal domain-like protein n=1 Tax=Nocardia transvalensis TaxID=37333 RepID=UPI00189467EC|nr:enolase C-terminal domain-like protein [Nocardia transvalensis]MBF6327016.1 mandelate racemase [Nocardia transvalensis]